MPDTESVCTRVLYAVIYDDDAVYWDYKVSDLCSNPIWDWLAFKPVAVVDVGIADLLNLNKQEIGLMGDAPKGVTILWSC